MYQTEEDTKAAAAAGKKIKNVDIDLTELNGYDKAHQSTATGER